MNRNEAVKIAILLIVLLLSGLRYFSQTDPLQDYLTQLSNPVASFINEQIYKDQNTVNQNQVTFNQSDDQLKEFVDENSVEAIVIKKEIANFKRESLINKGKSDGIKVGDNVLHQGYLYGKIVQVGTDWSRVQIISDPNFRSAAQTDTSQGVIENSGGSIVYALVNKNSLENKLVTTSGIGGEYVPGLKIGFTDKSIRSDDTNFATYSIILKFNTLQVREVQVIK